MPPHVHMMRWWGSTGYSRCFGVFVIDRQVMKHAATANCFAWWGCTHQTHFFFSQVYQGLHPSWGPDCPPNPNLLGFEFGIALFFQLFGFLHPLGWIDFLFRWAQCVRLQHRHGARHWKGQSDNQPGWSCYEDSPLKNHDWWYWMALVWIRIFHQVRSTRPLIMPPSKIYRGPNLSLECSLKIVCCAVFLNMAS